MTTQFLTLEKLQGIYGARQVGVTADTGAAVQTIIDVVNDYVEGKVRSGYGALGYPNAWTAALPEACVSMFSVPAAALAYVKVREESSGEADREAVAAANRVLENLALGKVSLPPLPAIEDDPETPEDEAASGAAFGSAPRLMGRCQLGGW